MIGWEQGKTHQNAPATARGDTFCLDLLPKAPWDRGTVLPHPHLPSPSARLCELLLIAPGP